MLRPILCSLALGLTLLSVRASDPLPTTTLDSIATQALQKGNLVGLAMEVRVPGLGTYRKAFGKGNLTTGEVRSPDSPFRIGSVTKTFFATAVLEQVEKGKLELTDPLSKWYPNFPNAELITVDDLLRMQSGIQDPFDDAWLAKYYADPFWNLTPDEVIAQAAALKSQFKRPGSETRYCNINYVFLEQILLQVTGLNADQAMQEAVWGPLELHQTSYPMLASDTGLPGPLRGYGWNGHGFDDKTLLNPVPPGGAGAMISTLDDLSVYSRALGKGTLLSSQAQAQRVRTRRMAGEPEFVQYGQGIARLGKFVGHNGTIQGFSTECWYLPDRDATFVLSVNRLDVDDKSRSTEVFLQVSKALFPRDCNW